MSCRCPPLFKPVLLALIKCLKRCYKSNPKRLVYEVERGMKKKKICFSHVKVAKNVKKVLDDGIRTGVLKKVATGEYRFNFDFKCVERRDKQMIKPRKNPCKPKKPKSCKPCKPPKPPDPCACKPKKKKKKKKKQTCKCKPKKKVKPVSCGDEEKVEECKDEEEEENEDVCEEDSGSGEEDDGKKCKAEDEEEEECENDENEDANEVEVEECDNGDQEEEENEENEEEDDCNDEENIEQESDNQNNQMDYNYIEEGSEEVNAKRKRHNESSREENANNYDERVDSANIDNKYDIQKSSDRHAHRKKERKERKERKKGEAMEVDQEEDNKMQDDSAPNSADRENMGVIIEHRDKHGNIIWGHKLHCRRKNDQLKSVPSKTRRALMNKHSHRPKTGRNRQRAATAESNDIGKDTTGNESNTMEGIEENGEVATRRTQPDRKAKHKHDHTN